MNTTTVEPATTEKVERPITKIAKKDQVVGEEYRLQYVASDKETGIVEGQYTPRIYGSEHAVMCAQKLFNANYEPGVRAVRAEVRAVEVVREMEQE
jgi:hypothetical protein